MKDRRFRGFTMTQVEHFQPQEDGSISVLGFSESGDAVALTVRPGSIHALVEGLQAFLSDRPS